jgi:hypothetical protein
MAPPPALPVVAIEPRKKATAKPSITALRRELQGLAEREDSGLNSMTLLASGQTVGEFLLEQYKTRCNASKKNQPHTSTCVINE